VAKPKQGVWLSPFMKFVFTDFLVYKSYLQMVSDKQQQKNTSSMTRQQNSKRVLHAGQEQKLYSHSKT